METVTGDTPGTVPRVSPQTIPEAALESVRGAGQLTVRGGATGAIPGSAHGSVRGGGLRIREGGGPGGRVLRREESEERCVRNDRREGREDGAGTGRYGANGTWVTLYYQDMGYSFRRRAAGFLPPGNA